MFSKFHYYFLTLRLLQNCRQNNNNEMNNCDIFCDNFKNLND